MLWALPLKWLVSKGSGKKREAPGERLVNAGGVIGEVLACGRAAG